MARVAYIDSSAYVKLPLGEPEAESLRAELDRYEGIFSSALLEIEAVRACARYGEAYAEQARAGLSRVALVPIGERLRRLAASLAPPALHALDAIHLATALELGEEVADLVTYDLRLADAARASGLTVLAPS